MAIRLRGQAYAILIGAFESCALWPAALRSADTTALKLPSVMRPTNLSVVIVFFVMRKYDEVHGGEPVS